MMYRTMSIALTLAILPLSLGCEKGTNYSGSASGTSSSDQKVSDAKNKLGDAVDASVVAAEAKRDEYAAYLSKQLDELDVKYEAMKVRAAQAQGDAKIEMDKKVAEAKIKRDAAAEKLEELKTASADRWEKIKDASAAAFEELKKAFE